MVQVTVVESPIQCDGAVAVVSAVTCGLQPPITVIAAVCEFTQAMKAEST